jgi:TolA-binding protein
MKRLLFLVLALSPAVLWGQKKEDILSIQRDVANLQDQVKQLQRSQDEKLAAMQGLLQQAVDASHSVATGLTGLQRDMDTKLSEQQGKLVAPVATLGTKVDQMADDFRSVATNVTDLVRRMNALDSKLTDISSAIRTLQAGPPQAPAPAGGAVPGAATAPPDRETLWQTAYRDYSSGKPELALNEFAEYVKFFPTTAEAPSAQYYIGYIYYNNGQYDSAIKAFEGVEPFPENSKTPEALYYKAVSLQKLDEKTAAAAAYREYLKRYPGREHADSAHKSLQQLGLERKPVTKKR